MVNWRTAVPLSTLTSMRVGGAARFFQEFRDESELSESLNKAKKQSIDFFILGGGSNIVVSDRGIRALVLKSAGVSTRIIESSAQTKILVAEAGTPWDQIVELAVTQGLSGIECMSGIPGTIGAAPIQNIGAYGQELCESLLWIEALDTRSLKIVRFDNTDCQFAYRHSRFKPQAVLNPEFVILRVSLQLHSNRLGDIRYKELKSAVDRVDNFSGLSMRDQLGVVRSNVIEIRKKKSMVIDDTDPNSRSCGSFFTNPILKIEEAEVIQKRASELGLGVIPQFESGTGTVKLSAARLVECAGFPRGTILEQAGTSTNHSLALIARGESASDVFRLAMLIQSRAAERLGVHLEFEPAFVGEF